MSVEQGPADGPAARLLPQVDLTRCEGKAACVRVCPYGVFRITRIEPERYRALPLASRLKLRVHGMKVATTPHLDQCHACGLCVTACPEQAIRLEPAAAPA